jgi:2-oxoglutarate dehydrogenase E1 component
MATKLKPRSVAPSKQQQTESPEREQVFDIFRRWGFLQASLDPLGQFLPPEPFPTPAPDGELSTEARAIYCGSIGAEFMHIADPARREWLQARMEQPATSFDTRHVLSQLICADLFEQTIQQRYLGTKRFSLEGLTALIPFLDQVFEASAPHGVELAMIGMNHRGRLNVMTNTIGRSATDIFARFEDVDPRSTLGGGDVKYHQGATGDYTSPKGEKIHLHLASNPSHLEAVNPVILGRTRAKQTRLDAQGVDGRAHVLPIVIHGDAAFAGQGVNAEALVLASIHGYDVGGTIHIIVNNLLGFTALPEESNSSRFATDLAKRMPTPIFHVNAEDPDAVVRAATIAADYRAQFRSDIVIDLIGYRRHGHSEVDDPTVTQPRRYNIIKSRPTLSELYAQKLGVDATAEFGKIREQFLADQMLATKAESKAALAELPPYWDAYKGGYLPAIDETKTGLTKERVGELVAKLVSVPNSFHIHPKVKKLFEQRAEMGAGKRDFDYGMAELVAYASLLAEGTPVRLSGQDSQRGTFNQRHSVLVDTETEVRYSPLSTIAKEGGTRWEAYNSMLSEAAVLGFEYGYSRDLPETLVLWEAQFGDFANGAQIILDQFIAAGEAKWHLLSGLVMLLPHGYEGGGPEHSSARIERYLQLAAQDNMRIAQPSTAAQYYHLLRRQALSPYRKPLVVFTPKSMLRHPDASSPIAEFTANHFLGVLPETEIENPRRLLVTSGKIGHNLRLERERRKDTNVGIVFLEQLYPFPEVELQAALDQHPSAQEIVWVQEEPANMGAFSYVMPLLRRVAGDRTVLSVKRTASASPATGSAKAHDLEEKALLDLAFSPLR